MKICFCGAAGEVTGSCYLVETRVARVLVDCGMFQGWDASDDKNHLKHNLWRASTQVVIVGYQAAGTLGGRLVHGARRVRIFGEEIEGKAGIHTLGGFSAHAGQTELAGWAGNYLSGPACPRLVLTHGEDTAREALRAQLQSRHGVTAELPTRGDAIEIE